MFGIEQIQKAALALSVKQRANLAESLLDSLPADELIWSEAEELNEVERREGQIKTGEVRPIPEDEFWKRGDECRPQ